MLTERAIDGAIGSSPMASGKAFTYRLFGLRKRAATGKHEFDLLCSDLGIDHRLAPPQHPQTNGMVERFNGRIEEVLWSHHFRSGEELETTLHRYVARRSLEPMAPSMARSVNTVRIRSGQARSRSRRNRRALAAVLDLQMRTNTQRVARSMATNR